MGIGLLVIRNLISIILGVLWVILLFSKLVFWHYMQPRNVDAIMLMQTESREIYFFFGNLFVVKSDSSFVSHLLTESSLYTVLFFLFETLRMRNKLLQLGPTSFL